MTLKKQNSLQEDLIRSSRKESSSLPYGPTEENKITSFSSKLAFVFGASKIPCGILLIIFGTVSILLHASMAFIGGGLWSGSVSILCGLFGIITSKHLHSTVHNASFLCLSALSIAASGIVTVFTSTGLAHDFASADSYYVDVNGHLVTFSGEMNTQTSILAINTSIIVISIIDCSLSIACCVVSAREICQCYTCTTSDPVFADPDSKIRRERLISWLGQQALMDAVLSGKVPPGNDSTPPRARWHASKDNNEENIRPISLLPQFMFGFDKPNSS